MKKIVVTLALFTFIVGGMQASFAQQQIPFNGPQGFRGPHHFKHQFERPRYELNDRLKLTSEQQTKSKEMREQARSQMKPIIEQMRTERAKFRELKESNASQEQLNQQKEKIHELMKQAGTIHKQNLENFEKILNNEQKKEFKSIKEERKERMEKFREMRKQSPGQAPPPKDKD